MHINKKNIKRLILSAILIYFVTIIGAFSLRNSDTQEAVNESKALEIVPLNHLIDNSLSELDETKRFDRDIIMFMRKWDIKGGSFALRRNDCLLFAKGFVYSILIVSIYSILILLF